MLTPIKKNHIEEKHRWDSGIDSWWERKKEGWGGISKWALHSVMNQRCFRSCWPFHNSIDSVTGPKKSHGTGEKKEKNAPEVNRWKQTVKGRKKFELQRLTYCLANPTWTGIYPQGHSQAGAAITIGKWTGVLACRTNSETTTCSVPEHIAVSSPANMNLFLCFSALHWQPCFIRTWVHSLQWHPAINRTNIFVKLLDVIT